MGHGDLHPPIVAVRVAVQRAVAEDLEPLGDITASLISPESTSTARFVARSAGVVAGTHCAIEVCRVIDPMLECSFELDDGEVVAAGQSFGIISGPLRSIVTAERSALNFLSHLSGIATFTRHFVEAISAVSATTTLWDTRKTTPGLRALEKAAVRAGGGRNHRGSLSEAILIKDNHLGSLDVATAIQQARSRWPGRMIEVECDRIDQIVPALDAGATVIMLDNFSPADVERGMEIADTHPRRQSGAVLVEVSGGVNLGNVAQYAKTGVDLISVGAVTHSAPILDIGLDLA